MADAGVRVALLARAGESRDQLRTALQDLGADLVCEGDPSELDPGAVSSLQPRVMVVSLEPATEAALDKFDDLLGSASIEVVYDDAEASAKLTGWDLNRWARHLAAKIIGTDLMPPIPEGSAMAAQDEWQPKPGAPETPAQAMADARLEDYLHETQSLATDVPVNESYSDALQREVPEVPALPEAEEDLALDFNLDDLEQAMRLNISNEHEAPMPDARVELEKRTADVDEIELAEFNSFISDEPVTAAISEELVMAKEAVPEALVHDIDNDDDFISFDNAQAEISDEISLGDDASFNIDLSAFEDHEVESKPAKLESSLEFEDSASTLADFEMSDSPVAFSKYQPDDAVEMASDMDADVAALAAQLDEFEKNDNRAVAKNMDFGMIDEEPKRAEPKRAEPSLELANEKPAAPTAPMATPAAKEPRTFDLSGLSLLDMDAEIKVEKVEPAKPVEAPAFKKSSLSLETMEGESPVEKTLSNVGAVLILAGMGGPDAVRQLLKALPTSLNVPVLLYQHLEVGKHDRLVAQLEKVSNMPVYLAVQGQSAEPGQVAVIPVGIGLDLVGNELFFGGAESQQALVESLPAKHSVVIVLSGAAGETAEAAVRVQSQGGLALAQDPANCFEPAAAEALIRQGGKTAEISSLATLVINYFKN